MNLLFKDALSRMQLMSLSKKSYSFRSGIMCLDDILKNFYAGTLVTIGGMSSMGKTTFALNLVNEFAIKQRHPLLFFSLEGTYSSWTNRLLSIVCNIKTTHFSDTRLLGADGLETLDKATRGIADAPIYLEAKKIIMLTDYVKLPVRRKKSWGYISYSLIMYSCLIQEMAF